MSCINDFDFFWYFVGVVLLESFLVGLLNIFVCNLIIFISFIEFLLYVLLGIFVSFCLKLISFNGDLLENFWEFVGDLLIVMSLIDVVFVVVVFNDVLLLKVCWCFFCDLLILYFFFIFWRFGSFLRRDFCI